MYNPHYLSLSRHSIYYFRFPIPANLHPQGKQTNIKVSLNTRCPREALYISHRMIYHAENAIKNPVIRRMEYQDIRELLTSHFRSMLSAAKDRMSRHGQLLEQDRQACSNGQALAQSALDNNEFSFIGTDDELNRFMQYRGVTIEQGSRDYELLRVEYLKAYRDYCAQVLEFNANLDNYDLSPSTESLATHQVSSKVRHKKLADTIEVYVEECLLAGRWKKSSAGGFQSQFNILVEYLGADASLHITSETANDVKRMLLNIPKGCRGKGKLQSIPLRELMKLTGHERMSAKSVSKYIGAYSTFFEWAVKRKETSENNFKVLIEKVKDKQQLRDAFTTSQLDTIVDELLNNTRKLHITDSYKWGTIIAIYTGARLNEIAQLQLSDIKQIDGVWCFDFNDEGDDRELKNSASRRVVPIHAALIKAGLLSYVEQVRKEKKDRLLHALTQNSHNGYGRNLGRWFRTFLTRLGLKSKKLVFHSFRHSAVTYLFQAGVDEPIVKTLVGHTLGGITHKVYAKGYTAAQLKEAIDKLLPVT